MFAALLQKTLANVSLQRQTYKFYASVSICTVYLLLCILYLALIAQPIFLVGAGDEIFSGQGPTVRTKTQFIFKHVVDNLRHEVGHILHIILLKQYRYKVFPRQYCINFFKNSKITGTSICKNQLSDPYPSYRVFLQQSLGLFSCRLLHHEAQLYYGDDALQPGGILQHAPLRTN